MQSTGAGPWPWTLFSGIFFLKKERLISPFLKSFFLLQDSGALSRPPGGLAFGGLEGAESGLCAAPDPSLFGLEDRPRVAKVLADKV